MEGALAMIAAAALRAPARPTAVVRSPVISPPLLEGTRKPMRLASLSPLRYPGSKRKMIPAIRQLLDSAGPRPKLFVEPFCGGASVPLGLLELDAVERVLLPDRDPLVSALWREVTTNGEELIKEMRKLKVTVDRWDYWRKVRPRSDRNLALKCLFLNRTTFSGIVGGRAGAPGAGLSPRRYRSR